MVQIKMKIISVNLFPNMFKIKLVMQVQFQEQQEIIQREID